MQGFKSREQSGVGPEGLPGGLEHGRSADVKQLEFLQGIFDALPERILYKDRESRPVLENQAWREKSAQADRSADSEQARAEDLQVLSTGQPVIDREEVRLLADGSYSWELISKFPVCDRHGQTVGLAEVVRDITQRKLAEGKSSDQHRLLHALVDAVPDLIFIKDLQGKHLAINAAEKNFLGVEGESIIGRSVYEWPIPREVADLYHADDRQVMETGQPLLNREEPFINVDGRTGHFLTSKFPLRDASGAICGLVGVARDITEFKRATDELERTRQRLVDHVENSPLAVIELRPDLQIERWNGQAQMIFGWPADEAVGRNFRELFLADDSEGNQMARYATRLLDGRDQRSVFQIRNRTRTGVPIHCVWHTSVLRGPGGAIVSILALVQDVTERVFAEQTIRENERLYRILIDTTNTGYVQCDENGCIMEGNAEFVRVAGRSLLSEIHGKPFIDLIAFHDAERARRELDRLWKAGFMRNLEVDFIHRDGRTVPVEINASLRQTASGERMLAFCRNISSRRHAELERQAIERKLLESQKLESMGVLAGGIAHDFNNLLTGVLGNASLARVHSGTDSPVQSYLEQIEVAATRAAELCRQMLAYSGKGRFVVTRLDLNAVVRETAKLLQISISKKAAIHFSLTEALPTVVADLTQIRQVIMNLIINAAEAAPERPVKIQVSTFLVAASDERLNGADLLPDSIQGDYLCLEILDDGLGMSPAVQARIFDPFFTTKFTGRGLGLAAVLGIVRGHLGALKVQSKSGDGTCFRVFLPCTQGPADVEPEIVPLNTAWKGSGTVLVVDDEPTVRQIGAHMLEALGFETVTACDGRDAVETFARLHDRITLVLLDLTMPGMDGDEVLHEIRALSQSVPVLLMSGFDRSEVVSRFAGDQAADFIQKPFLLAALAGKLQQLLA